MLARTPRYAEENSRHEMLLACFRSGQMNDRQLQGHMADDPDFKSYVEEAIRYSDARRGS